MKRNANCYMHPLVTIFMIVSLICLLIFMAYQLYQYHSTNWQIPIVAVARKIYENPIVTDHSLEGFPWLLCIIPALAALLVFIIIKFGLRCSSRVSSAISIFLFAVLSIVLIISVIDYYLGFGERVKNIVQTFGRMWYSEDHNITVEAVQR